MKPHLDIKHEGTLPTEGRVLMTFDQDSIAHLMSILTDLYSDPELAVIREYSANALDSHVEAGNPDPIEVFLPTDLYPIFRVVDHGVGLTLDEVNNHLSKYGWSSKRETNDAIGMLGLGFKSALTYTSQFTVVATKDGMRATVLVTREHTGQGALQTIAHEPTDDPNGVEVMIPVKSVPVFNARARDFFQFWDKGLVLVDGQPPECIWDRQSDFMSLDPDVLLLKNYKADYVVMGNVAYRVPFGEPLVPKAKNVNAIIKLTMGDVDFTPSREDLQMTKRTKEALDTAREFIETQVERVASREVEGAGSYSEALRQAQKWRRVWTGEVKYRGLVVPDGFNSEFPNDEMHGTGWYKTRSTAFKVYTGHSFDTPAERAGTLTVDQALAAVHVVGFPGKYVNGLTKEKLRILVAELGRSIHDTIVYFHRSPAWGHPWLQEATFIKWEDLHAVKVPGRVVQRVRSKDGLPYRVLSPYGNPEVVADPPTGELVWMLTTAYGVEARQSMMRHIKDLDLADKVTLVAVNKQQERRFKVENPEAVHIIPWLKAIIYHWQRSFTDIDYLYLKDPQLVSQSGLRKLDPDRVIDPELASLIRTLGADREQDRGIERDHLRQLATCVQSRLREAIDRATGGRYNAVQSKLHGQIMAAMKKYPLLPIMSQRHYYYLGSESKSVDIKSAHMLEYLNMTWMYRNEVHLIPATY